MTPAERREREQEVAFAEWLNTLKVDVIQGEYGYEEGEFTVYGDLWRPDFEAGRSPKEAFDEALRAAERARKARDAERKENWARIVREDVAALRKEAADLRSIGNDMHTDSASMAVGSASEIRRVGIAKMRRADEIDAQADALAATLEEK